MIPNLRTRYGKLYRITQDPAADTSRDPWMHVIQGRAGCAYVHSPTHAGVEIPSRRRKALAALRQAGHKIHLDAADVVIFLVPWPQLLEVLPLIKPYKRRQTSDAERQRLAGISKRTRFQRRDGTGARLGEQGATISPKVDPTPA